MAERNHNLRAVGLLALGIVIGNAPEIYQTTTDNLSNLQHTLQESDARLEREKEAERIAKYELAKKYGIDEISEFGLVGKRDLIGTPTYITLKDEEQERHVLRINWVDNEGSIIVSYLNPETVKYIIPEDPITNSTTEFKFTDDYLQFLGWNPDKWGINANDYLDDSRVTTLITINQAGFDSIHEATS